MLHEDGLLRDEVLTVADAVTAVATATGATVPVSTTATTRECSMKTSVTDAMETRRESVLAREKKKEPYWDGTRFMRTRPKFVVLTAVCQSVHVVAVRDD